MAQPPARPRPRPQRSRTAPGGHPPPPDAGDGFAGVSGLIRFGPDSGEPVAKRISLMRVDRITDVNREPVEVFHCGGAEEGTPAGTATTCSPD